MVDYVTASSKLIMKPLTMLGGITPSKTTQWSHNGPFIHSDAKSRGAVNCLVVRLMVNERYGRTLDQIVMKVIKEGILNEDSVS
jgi:hypothetical protein